MVSSVIFWFRRDLRLSDNPTRPAGCFDPEGDYVRRYVRELAGVAPRQCWQPGAGEGLLAPAGYVAPMVDAAVERSDALARFHEARQRARRSLMDEGVA